MHILQLVAMVSHSVPAPYNAIAKHLGRVVLRCRAVGVLVVFVVLVGFRQPTRLANLPHRLLVARVIIQNAGIVARVEMP